MKFIRLTLNFFLAIVVLLITSEIVFAYAPNIQEGFAAKFFRQFEERLDKQLSMFLPPACVLLTNTDLDTNLTGWTTSGTVSNTTDSYAGSKAAKLSSSYATMSQSQTGITPGKMYTLSVQAKISGSLSWVVVKLGFYNGNTKLRVCAKITSYLCLYLRNGKQGKISRRFETKMGTSITLLG
ncbi:MAG: hypothetical protein K9J37_11650 [Saprospiraceae bacterium]|nr:hypothetical protein [Saprospiraceae bacterium]MCF8250561.1 hypothetical protein [Saprospiraceae bacterium]MCF8282791.1 hypothetical protein [Bacteroidales bacterium]MCF8313120.1 hypothetical protein [Saprospiraceae bacterium]MCF8441516.1 hypothetical protein [Saprospiraceae bacterium]